jgi:cyanuric acid amidohydrolase
MKTYQTEVFRIPMNGPGDMSGLEKLIGSGAIEAKDIVAIFGKTEGNGCVNDFTREYASRTFASTLSGHLKCSASEVESRVALIMSGGTEGVLSPHATVFTRKTYSQYNDENQKSLAIGISHTRDFLPEEIGRAEQINETALSVKKAMEHANIDNYEDVHFIQIKCPLLTSERISAAKDRKQNTVTEDTYASMAYSRGASALGVAVGLGQIDLQTASENILSDWQLSSDVASASAGVELNHSVVVVLGNSKAASSDHTIGHAVMQDALDWGSVIQAFSNVGIDTETLLANKHASETVNIFAKAESSPDGLIRGMRHTMLDDSDIHSTRHARAAVGGMIASIAGTGAVYVSGGAEHQGPPGGGPVAVIKRFK